MAEEPPAAFSVTERAIEASRSVLMSVPPSFLGLLLLNMCFLGIVLWFLNSQVEARMALVGKIIDACVIQPRKEQ